MPPTTRSKKRAFTPERTIERCEHSTRKRIRFFEAYDTRYPAESLPALAAEKHIPQRTASRWVRERTQIGSPAYRRTRKRSEKLGRREKVLKETYKILVSPSRNPVRDQLYKAQIEYFNLPIKKRAL